MVVKLFGLVSVFFWALATCCFLSGHASSSMHCPSIIVDLYLGEPVSLDVALDDMANSGIVYVGEYHTIPCHHQLHADIMKGLVQRNGISGLAMEMFTWVQQPIVDQWLESDDSVSVLLQKLGSGAWTNLKDYEAVLLMARDLRIPVICLNAPENIVRKVSRKGVDSLSDTERDLLPKDIEPIDPDYARLLNLKLRVHRAFEGKSLKRIIYSQALRDAVMASNIISFMKRHPQSGKSLMVIAGNGHINYGFGVPDRVRRNVETSFRIILPSESGELQLSEAEKQQAIDIDISHKDVKFIGRPIADYLSVFPVRPDNDQTGPEAPNVAKARQTNATDSRR